MTDTRIWDDVVREKLDRIAADLRTINARLDRLEAMQGGGLSVMQALTALDRYDTQEEADLDLRRRVEALERASKPARAAMLDAMQEIDALVGASTPDIGLHNHKPFGGLHDDGRCEDCGAAPGDLHAADCASQDPALEDEICKIPPEETPAVKPKRKWWRFWS